MLVVLVSDLDGLALPFPGPLLNKVLTQFSINVGSTKRLVFRGRLILMTD